MTRERAKIGFGEALNGLDSFAPAPRGEGRLAPALDAAGAAAAGFVSREIRRVSPHAPGEAPSPAAGASAPEETAAAPARAQRRRRTGRNVQINIKTTAETLARFYALADGRGLGVGEAFERAVALLEAETPGD